MKARGREVYIVTAVIIVVVVVAWWFLFYSPVRSKAAELEGQIERANSSISSTKVDIQRLEGYQRTAPQTQADLLRLNKMMPAEAGIPSVIVEITRTAEESGLDFVRIEPLAVAAGQPFGVEPITLTFSGLYYDVEDFLFRLESYVEYRNDEFLVTGRLLQVGQIQIHEGAEPGLPNLTIDITVNAYLWTQPQESVGTPAPAASPDPTPGATPGPSVTPSESPTEGFPTESPTVSPTGSPSP